MFKSISIVLLLLFSGSNCFAQDKALYFNDDFEPSLKEEASYYRLVYNYKDGLLLVKNFYINGKKQAVGFSKDFPALWSYPKTGRFTVFYQNGQIEYFENYVSGVESGNSIYYFENGKKFMKVWYSGKKNETEKVIELYDENGQQLVTDGNGQSIEINSYDESIEYGEYQEGLKRGIWMGEYKNGETWYEESYNKGILISGKSYDKAGKEYAYKELEIEASFRGGEKKMYNFINNEVRYPENAQLRNIEGAVYLKFRVGIDGKITEIRTLKSPHRFLSNEAIRVLKKMSGKWDPLITRGQKVNCLFTMPIVFKLE